MAAEMSVFKSQGRPRVSIATSTTTSCAPSPSLGADLLHQRAIKQELEDYPFELPTPQNSIDPSTSCFSTPSASIYSRSPSPSHVGLGLDAIPPASDMTQHPAAMLCGLQCQSEAWIASIPPTNRDEARRLQQVISSQFYLMLISAVYSRLLLPLRLIFISLRTGSPLPSTITPKTNPMIFLLIRWLILTPANLTSTTSTNPTTLPITTVTRQPTSLNHSPVRRPTFRIRLLRRLLLCSLALARPLKGATDRAMRPKTSDMLSGLPAGSSRGGDSLGVGRRELTSLVDVGVVSGMAMARTIDKIESEFRRNRHLARRVKRKCTTRKEQEKGKF